MRFVGKVDFIRYPNIYIYIYPRIRVSAISLDIVRTSVISKALRRERWDASLPRMAEKEKEREKEWGREEEFTGASTVSPLLSVQSVYRPIAVIALDVRVHVRPVLACVHAVRAFETRRLTALVLQMPVEAAIPLVGLLTLRTVEVSTGRCVHRLMDTAAVPSPPSFRTHDGQVRQCGQVEYHCKLQISSKLTGELVVKTLGENVISTTHNKGNGCMFQSFPRQFYHHLCLCESYNKSYGYVSREMQCRASVLRNWGSTIPLQLWSGR